MIAKLIICLGSASVLWMVPVPTAKEKTPTPVYRVVLDPGHGGANVFPVAKFGDRYDRISGTYLEVFREGSQGGGLEESELMYRIADKVKAILAQTETDSGWESFRSTVLKYSSGDPKRIVVKGFLSRKKNRSRHELLKLKDPNADYRLFDYPGRGGGILPGRISYINSVRPHLVVSLHCAQSSAKDQIGMSAVICPPHSFFEKGLEVLQHRRTDKSFFFSGKYASWFEERSSRSLYRWFLSDTSMYFLGYPLDSSDSVNFRRFKGYRYNMVTWPYMDADGWEKTAAAHHANTRYASSLKSFVPDGPYWDRERSRFEEFRRGNGPEGFGGDNLYGSHEIIRYVLTALAGAGYKSPALRLADPFISVWSVPLYVNAVSAYIELGYLREPVHLKMFREKTDILAEGIAVGIYSLLAGTEPKPSADAFRPKGAKFDLDKYRMDDTKTYFDAACQ